MTSAINQMEVMLDVLGGLVRDIEQIHSLPPYTLEGSFQTVASSARSRGLNYLLIEFPSLCDALDKALDSGIYEPVDGAPHHVCGRPTIFQELYAKILRSEPVEVYDEYVSYGWRDVLEYPCHEAVRSLRQIYRLLKKVSLPCDASKHKDKIHEFKAIEQDLIEPSFSWNSDSLSLRGRFPTLVEVAYRAGEGIRKPERNLRWNGEYNTRTFKILDRINLIADLLIGKFRFNESERDFRHGPGAVAEGYLGSKFEFPTWPWRLEQEFPFDKYGIINHALWEGSPPSDSEVAAKLIAVDKDYKGPRLIASEPICRQYIQQGILQVLRRNVAKSPLRYAIDFRSQEPSKTAALGASIDGGHSTIDLSSASDRLSCAVVEAIFRSNWIFLRKLWAARTHLLDCRDGDVLELQKFAAQGAAFTFPVQSIVYAIICMGAISYEYDKLDLKWLAQRVRVFGDDMIVPTHVVYDVMNALQALQLKVNTDKSFTNRNENPVKGLSSSSVFRESCGMDAYGGTDVTPVYVRSLFERRNPTTMESLLECQNSLYLKGYFEASRRLLVSIPWKMRKHLATVSRDSTVLGVVSSHRNVFGLNKKRYNVALQRHETKILVVETKVSKSTPDGHDSLFQWFVESPSQETVWAPGYKRRVQARYRLRWAPSSMLGFAD